MGFNSAFKGLMPCPGHFTLGKETKYPLYRRLGGWAPRPVWMNVENLISTGIRSLDFPAHTELLYWPCYPSSRVWCRKPYNEFQLNFCNLRSIVNIFGYKLKYTFPFFFCLLIFRPSYDTITCTYFARYILWRAYLTLSSFLFHRLHPLERVEDVEAFYFERVETLRETFGVLLLLYSVISTKVYFYFLLLHFVVSVQYSYLNSVNIHEI